ncbi:MAG TPA: aldo/keto reductase [Caulobacteraceae bacterium]|jgi:aryl-alcohol dehydrogenase-like predicted oxidoreductase|nr:aldo/keto reductase [Caulobacteraceae bacterium]
MQTVRLGRTGAEVSVAGLGCGGASRLGMAQGADVDQAAGVVRRALELGVTFIDTARNYGTEEAVGLGIRGRRDQVFLSTKSSAGRGERMFTAAELTESLEGSLRRLGADRVDVFHLHGVTPGQYDYCAEVLVPEMRRQQAAGKIRFLGVTEQFGGDTGHRMLSRALPDDLFDVVMVGFNLLNPSARARVFPLTRAHDVGTLVMFAVRRLLSQPAALREAVAGLIERGEVDGAEVDAADPLGFLREHADVGSLTEAAYRFCRHEPGADVILTGTGNVQHLEANLAAIQGPPLAPDITERLRSLFGGVDSVSGN